MNAEEELIYAPTLDTPNEAQNADYYGIIAEDYSFRFVLPRIILTFLLAFTVVAAPFLLWRVWLGLSILQSSGIGGGVTALFILAVGSVLWIRRKRFSGDIWKGAPPVQGTLRLRDGIQNPLPWLRERWEAFGRLALMEKEVYLYFMLAAIPGMGIFLFGATPLLWGPLVTSFLTLMVPAGLIFGLAGLMAGLLFWTKTGELKTAYLVLVALYLNFAYESGGAIFIR